MGNRIYYAIQQVGIRPNAIYDYVVVHGLQSITSNGAFSVSPIASLGDMSEYIGGLEDSNEVNFTLKKLLDGYPSLYNLATNNTSGLASGLNRQCDIVLSIFDDVLSSASGEAVNTMQSTGLYISSFKYIFDTSSNFTEELSFIGSNKIWKKDDKVVNSLLDQTFTFGGLDFAMSKNIDEPLNAKIGRRQHFDISTSRLPRNIIGVNSNGIISGAHLTSVSISASFNRENIPSLGNKGYHCRILSFPIDITTEITANAVSNLGSGDTVSMDNIGILSDGTPCEHKGNILSEKILISILGYVSSSQSINHFNIDLGTGNKLVAVSQQGGDAGGGLVTVNYTYKTSQIKDCFITQDTNFNVI